MFKIYIPDLAVILSINSTSGDKSAKIVFGGNKTGQDIVKKHLSIATGAFGHLFSPDNTTPVDLHYALISTMPDIEIKILKGAEMVKNYNSGIPSGAYS